MPKPLTSLERRILDYIVEYLRKNTYQPSIREIGRRFGIKSTKTVSEYLQSLADKGWVERDPSRSRGVRLIGLDMNPETVTVPRFAVNSAKQPDAVVEEFEIDRKLVGGSGTFCITMNGEALAADGIRDGDLLLVEPAELNDLENGDLVFVRVPTGPNVRRVARDNGALQLVSSDAPVIEDTLRGVVGGRIISVVRRLRAPLPGSEPAATA